MTNLATIHSIDGEELVPVTIDPQHGMIANEDLLRLMSDPRFLHVPAVVSSVICLVRQNIERGDQELALDGINTLISVIGEWSTDVAAKLEKAR